MPSASPMPRPAPHGLVIDVGGSNDIPSLERMPLSEATASVTKRSFYLADTPDAVAREAFLQSSAVAAAVPCLKLVFPRVWDVYPELISMLEATEASLR